MLGERHGIEVVLRLVETERDVFKTAFDLAQFVVESFEISSDLGRFVRKLRLPVTFILDRPLNRFGFFHRDSAQASTFCLRLGQEFLRLAPIAVAFFLEPNDVIGGGRLQLCNLLRRERAKPGYLSVYINDRREALALLREPHNTHDQTH